MMKTSNPVKLHELLQVGYDFLMPYRSIEPALNNAREIS